MRKDLISIFGGFLVDTLANAFGGGEPDPEPLTPLAPELAARMPTPEELDADRRAQLASMAVLTVSAIDDSPRLSRRWGVTRNALASFVDRHAPDAWGPPPAPAPSPLPDDAGDDTEPA